MLRRTLALLTLLALPTQVSAGEEVIAGLSQNRVAITATFVGSEILIFGAVKRESPPPGTGDLNVVVVVEGPSHPVTVRRKEKRYGIWINTDAVKVDQAPSFYAIATSAPFEQAISETEDLRHHISIPRSVRLVGEAGTAPDIESFSQAVIRIRSASGLYKLEEGAVEVQQDTLFNTSVTLPSNLTEGEYTARIFLTRQGAIVSEFETQIEVQKVGLERWIFNLAHERPLVYGILSLVIAIAAGWTASAAFRVLLRS